jgi:hypothetical protein
MEIFLLDSRSLVSCRPGKSYKQKQKHKRKHTYSQTKHQQKICFIEFIITSKIQVFKYYILLKFIHFYFVCIEFLCALFKSISEEKEMHIRINKFAVLN